MQLLKKYRAWYLELKNGDRWHNTHMFLYKTTVCLFIPMALPYGFVIFQNAMTCRISTPTNSGIQWQTFCILRTGQCNHFQTVRVCKGVYHAGHLQPYHQAGRYRRKRMHSQYRFTGTIKAKEKRAFFLYGATCPLYFFVLCAKSRFLNKKEKTVW